MCRPCFCELEIHGIIKGTRPNIGREPDHGKRTRLIFRLNRQSFYRNRKRQLVPIDRYRFPSIGKLIGSVSHDRVAYRYLDAFPYHHPNNLSDIFVRAQLPKTDNCNNARASPGSFWCNCSKCTTCPYIDHGLLYLAW